jgi:hypothetical protein
MKKNPTVSVLNRWNSVQEISGNLGLYSYGQAQYDVEARWAPWNGGVGQVQLAWLRGQLNDARRAQQRVLVFAHCPFHPAVVRDRTACLLWNYLQLLQVLQQSGIVVATFSGASLGLST